VANEEQRAGEGLRLQHPRPVQSGLHQSAAAVCTDCHGEHDIAKVSKKESYVDRYKLPQTCSKCHQKIAEAYQASVHGKLLAQGNQDVPTCSDCHGEHTIQKHDDPNSRVYSGNVTRPAAHATKTRS